MKILKMSKKEDEDLYFICSCGCEFKEEKRFCTYNDYGNQYDSGYEIKCPCCGKIVGGGMKRDIYIRYFNGKG